MIQSSDNRRISDVISDVTGSSSCVSSENLSLASDQPGRSCLQGERSLQEEGEHHQTDVSLSSTGGNNIHDGKYLIISDSQF